MVPLPIVDGCSLDASRRAALRPDELVSDDNGRASRLPRFFYEVDSWQTARQTELAPSFALWEFIDVDMHEAEALRTYPRYVPCAVTLLAVVLALVRQQLGHVVHVAANGAYRSPSHARSRRGSVHAWGTAANIYAIGDERLDTQPAIERAAAAVARVCPAAWIRPFGHNAGQADDHLHVDVGCVTLVPRLP
jgi:hypothetical protein